MSEQSRRLWEESKTMDRGELSRRLDDLYYNRVGIKESVGLQKLSKSKIEFAAEVVRGRLTQAIISRHIDIRSRRNPLAKAWKKATRIIVLARQIAELEQEARI